MRYVPRFPRDKQKKLEVVKPAQDLYRQYLQTVLQATDEYNQRRAREAILRGLLESLFAQKDLQRGFTAERRSQQWLLPIVRRQRPPARSQVR